MNNELLYPCFNKWIGSIWFISDTHFGDTELKTVRSISDDELVNRINRKVSKKDTLVLLGDVGDLTYVQKLKAGYKVLILGNHDKGASNYKKITFKANISDAAKQEALEKIKVLKKKIENEQHDTQGPIDINPAHIAVVAPIKEVLAQYSVDATEYVTSVIADAFDYLAVLDMIDKENLFDEVYEGALMINEKIMLSHEPFETPYTFNIHGHDHSGSDFKKYVLKQFDTDMSIEDMGKNYLAAIKRYSLKKINVCADWVGFSPVSLKDIMKSGVLKDILDIHRNTIDKATERAKERK